MKQFTVQKFLICYYQLSFDIKREFTNNALHKITAGMKIRLELKRKKFFSQQVRTFCRVQHPVCKVLARCFFGDSSVFCSRFFALRTRHLFIGQIRQITASQSDGDSVFFSITGIICD